MEQAKNMPSRLGAKQKSNFCGSAKVDPFFKLQENMKNQILVGKILKPQGIKGEVKVKPILDKLERFSSFEHFFVGKEKSLFEVEKIDVRFGYAYVTFKNIKTRNDAETLRNKDLYVSREDFGKLDEDSYLLEDLIGLDVVYSGTNQCVGKIIDIDQYGSADVINVLSTDGRKYQLPFLKAVFLDINLSDGVIYVDKKMYEEMKI